MPVYFVSETKSAVTIGESKPDPVAAETAFLLHKERSASPLRDPLAQLKPVQTVCASTKPAVLDIRCLQTPA